MNFSVCVRGSSFPDFWKVSSVALVFKDIEEKSMTKNYCLVSLLSVVSKVFEKLVNNKLAGYLEECGKQVYHKDLF